MATYNRNARAIDVVVWVPFVKLTGVVSNIDDVIAAVGGEHVIYRNGELTVGGVYAPAGNYVGQDEDENPVNMSLAEITAEWTVA